jgi:hypothetical protein
MVALTMIVIFIVASNVQATSTTHYPPGSPAIQPHVNGATGNAPTFTSTDAAQYVTAHGFPGGVPVQGSHLVITNIQFMTAKVANAQFIKTGIDRPDDALVCVVQVKGPFNLIYAHLSPTDYAKHNVPVARTGFIVYDARTGNFLLWTAYGQPKSKQS